MASSTATATAVDLEALDLRCPPLPNTLLEAVELTHTPGGPDLERALELVQRDPAVAARVLRVINSAYYGQRGDVTSVRRAVVALGPSTVVGLVLSMSMMDTRTSLDAGTTLPFLNLVRHSVATAFVAQQLGNYARAPYCHQQGVFFTAGLLHDFGKLIFLFNYPGAAVRLYAAEKGGASPRAADVRLDAERTAFGYDHALVGATLAERLRFPDALASIIAVHHDDRAALSPPALLVAAADAAANGLGYHLDAGTDWNAVREDPVWAHLAASGILELDSADAVLQMVDDVRQDLTMYVDSVF